MVDKRFLCLECLRPSFEDYMLTNELWLKVAGSRTGRMHLACVEKRLRRRLCKADFQPHAEANNAVFFGYRMGGR